jgi:hypothetical protein
MDVWMVPTYYHYYYYSTTTEWLEYSQSVRQMAIPASTVWPLTVKTFFVQFDAVIYCLAQNGEKKQLGEQIQW